jgi:hypothetical protein
VLDVQIIQPPRAPSDMTDAEIGNAAAACVDQHLAMRSGAIEQAVRAGELLLEARHRCREQASSWSDWCRRYWPKSRRTADTYMKVAMEVNPEKSGERAPSMTADALLALPSVRALLTSTGHGAGGTRDEPEQIAGMREPGADEDEDANTPTGDMRAPTPAEQATVDRLSSQHSQSDADRAAERLERREEWKAKKRAEERQAKEQETAEQRMARVAQAAADKARMAAEFAAIKAAEDRPAGPEAPRPKPAAPVEVLSVGPDADAMEELVLAIQRRWGLVRMEPAPMVEKFGRMVMHPRDEARDYVAEWVAAGTGTIRHLRDMKDEDVKVARAVKRAASVDA